ncbi:uncharacterized protein LOC116337866 [Contarinia nasturtii]|uniref:uncharacterized protein LOC116337866 n=1 Tax=Contarinia nasturtii TaxID=265458 RepID=UPI0012D431B2|nr:uncharacterized protein LOC116337866 [Contarinia nasturtii]
MKKTNLIVTVIYVVALVESILSSPTAIKLENCIDEHSKCTNIQPGQTIFGVRMSLTNENSFRIYLCSCERSFDKCLSDVNTPIADEVAEFYFKVQNKCYMRIKQPTCTKNLYESILYGNVLLSRCMEYTTNPTTAIEPRLLDNNLYVKNEAYTLYLDGSLLSAH